MAKRIGDVDQDLITTGGLVIGGFFLVRYILKSLNIGVDPADVATIQAAQTAAPAGNPFNPQFNPFVDLYNQNVPFDSNGNPFTMQSFFTQLKQVGDANPNFTTTFIDGINNQAVYANAEALESLLTGFHLLGTDHSVFIRVIT